MVALNSREVKLAAQMLEEGGENPAQLAKAVIEAVDDIRAGKLHYVSVIQWSHEPAVYTAYGPYPTKNAALKDMEKGRVAPIPMLARAVVPVYSLKHLDAQWEDVEVRQDLKGDWLAVREDSEAFREKRRKRG